VNPARRRGIYWSGIGLLIFGAVLARWSIQHSSQLVNYQRLALMLPLLYAVPMLYVDTILDWSNASLRNRIRAGGAVFCALLLTVGAILWFIAAPLARG
jgi:hypothetical protein